VFRRWLKISRNVVLKAFLKDWFDYWICDDEYGFHLCNIKHFMLYNIAQSECAMWHTLFKIKKNQLKLMERNTWENSENQKCIPSSPSPLRHQNSPSTILRHRRYLPPPPSSSPPSNTFPLLFLPCDNLFFKFDEFDLEWILRFIEENQLKLIRWGLLLLRSLD